MLAEMAAYTEQLEHTTIYNRNLDDSEESDGEGGLGNLNRLIVRPAGHSGKAKRGQLCFDAAFECGNLGRADHITDLEYDLYVRPDTCRPRARFWFNFTVENVKQDQRVIFNIVNLGKEVTLFDTDMTPLVRSTSRGKWVRIPRRFIFYHRSILHRGRKILSMAFAFDREEDVYQFTAAAPYSYSRLQKYLAIWEKRAQAFAKRESIAQSTQKRRIDLITIGDFNFLDKAATEEPVPKPKVNEPKKRVIIILARSHGGEPPASFMCQALATYLNPPHESEERTVPSSGTLWVDDDDERTSLPVIFNGFLDFIGSSSEKACALRNSIIIHVVPMLNPDGVFLGNQRSDLLGSDPNRSWHNPTSFAHPAHIAVHELVEKIMTEKALQLDFIIDLHGDISHEGVFVRGNSYDDVYRFERHAVLPKFLSGRVEAWRQEACMYNADAGLAGSARRALPVGNVDAYTLLASLGGRRLSARGPYIHYTEDAYSKIGRALAKGFCDYYRHIGVVPPRIGLSSKKKESRGRRRKRRPVTGRERSPSSSPERRALTPRILSPSLPAASPAPRVFPPRTAKHLRTARPRTMPDIDHALPAITGTAVRTPRLAVVDMSAYIRAPVGVVGRRLERGPTARLSRAPRPSHARFTSDEYDTQDSDRS